MFLVNALQQAPALEQVLLDSAQVPMIFSAVHMGPVVPVESLERARKQAHALEQVPLVSAQVPPISSAALEAVAKVHLSTKPHSLLSRNLSRSLPRRVSHVSTNGELFETATSGQALPAC